MDLLKKIRNQPENIRKIILWVIIIIVGLGLAIFWVKNFQKRLKSFQKEELKEKLQLPSLQEKLRGIPKIEIPEVYEK